VARGTQHRKRRPAANAAVATKPKAAKPNRVKHEAWEEQLFFSRLRSHAKWVFVFLAFVFALSFVLFGVGSGSTGISDAMRNFFTRSSSSGPSVSGLEHKTQQNPKDAQAWRDLATAQEQKNNLPGAIAALTRYTGLRPNNQDALQELGGLYLRQSDNYAQQYVTAQSQASSLLPGTPFQLSTSSPFGQQLQDPITSGITASTSTATSDAYQKYINTQTGAVGVYKKLAALNPKDATNQYRLGQVSQAAGNSAEAIIAYTAFLKLAPNDPLAPTAKKALKQLTAPKTAPKASAKTTG
jgi:cytochrome c-type biogenesis protein CcmH/NrfG